MSDCSSTSPNAATKEAQQFWGHLFRPNKCGTDLLNRLLEGIAVFVAGHFGSTDSSTDITPSQLAGFYKAVGGDYDVLFVDTPSASVAFIYKSLGCLHSLQPAPDSDGYSIPTIPALKTKGFVTWQTIQLLLGPDEHVPFLQGAVKEFDIVDPGTGHVFPKLLPKQSFPEKPDEDMLRWYESVSNRLREECEAEEKEQQQQQQQEQQQRQQPDNRGDSSEPDSSNDDCSADERSGAAAYFRNPLYRDRRGRPTIIRNFPRTPRSPREFGQERGTSVADSNGRHVRTAWSRSAKYDRRRGSLSDDPDDDNVGPAVTGPPPGYSSSPKPPPCHQRRHERQGSRSRSRQSDTSSDSDDLCMPSDRLHEDQRRRISSDNRHAPLRHWHSHSPPSSPREYLPRDDKYAQGRNAGRDRRASYSYTHPSDHHRRRDSDASFRTAKEQWERTSPRQRERHSRDRERDYERGDREITRPDSRNARDHFVHQSPATPPPMKTYSGTNLSAMGSPGHHPPLRPSSNGFKPTHEPIFATKVAHLQPPPAQLNPNGPNLYSPGAPVHPGQFASHPTYYDYDGYLAGASHGRRPSYPPRGPSSPGAHRVLLPTRAQSVRYADRASPRWTGSRNSSSERDTPSRELRRDRAAGHRYVQSIHGIAMDGVGGRRY